MCWLSFERAGLFDIENKLTHLIDTEQVKASVALGMSLWAQHEYVSNLKKGA